MDQRGNKRKLTPEQRKAKIERDRKRRRENKTEFERLQKVEVDLTAQNAKLQNESRQLREEVERLNNMVSDSQNTIKKQNAEFERIEKAQADLKALVANLRNESRHLREKTELLNNMVSDLQNTIHELRQQNLQLYQKNLQLEDAVATNLADSYFDLSTFPSPKEEEEEEVENGEPNTQRPGSSM